MADEKIVATPNVRVYRELVGVRELGDVNERIAVAVERLSSELVDLRGNEVAGARPPADGDVFEIDRP